MIITIGGLAGTGTSTTAKVLSEKLNIPYVSAGDVFRQLAAENDMDVIQFSKYAEDNPTIDMELDKRQVKIAEESDDLILEGRLSGRFVDADINIWLITPFDVRAERICDRESKTIELAKSEIKIREESEVMRYKDIHGIDISNLEPYDIILNTHSFSPDHIAEIIIKIIEVIKWQQ